MNISPSYVDGLELRIKELDEQVEKLTKERDSLVASIDNEIVVTHMGVFNAGDDPKAALNKICCYAQDLGKFFAEDACKEQLASLAEQNEKMREALAECEQALDECRDYPVTLNLVIEALSLPDLMPSALNRIKAEAYRELVSVFRNEGRDEVFVDRIEDEADALEKRGTSRSELGSANHTL